MRIVAGVSSAFQGEDKSAFPDEAAPGSHRRSRGYPKKF
jgi:hypothetical protein